MMVPTARKVNELRSEAAQLSAKLIALQSNKEDLDAQVKLTKRRMRDVNAVLEGYNLAQQEASELKMVEDASDT